LFLELINTRGGTPQIEEGGPFANELTHHYQVNSANGLEIMIYKFYGNTTTLVLG